MDSSCVSMRSKMPGNCSGRGSVVTRKWSRYGTLKLLPGVFSKDDWQ